MQNSIEKAFEKVFDNLFASVIVFILASLVVLGLSHRFLSESENAFKKYIDTADQAFLERDNPEQFNLAVSSYKKAYELGPTKRKPRLQLLRLAMFDDIYLEVRSNVSSYALEPAYSLNKYSKIRALISSLRSRDSFIPRHVSLKNLELYINRLEQFNVKSTNLFDRSFLSYAKGRWHFYRFENTQDLIELKEAIERLEEATVLFPRSLVYRLWYVRFLKQAGKQELALLEASKALSVNSPLEDPVDVKVILEILKRCQESSSKC